MHILLTNDDGYRADGIRSLYDALSAQHQVTVIAPASEQSGVGHGFTHSGPLVCRALTPRDNMRGYAVAGTPSDCVKLGLAQLCPAKPDMVVSGINAGENTGIAVVYSGTVAAAREGALWGVASAAFSTGTEGTGFFREFADHAAGLLPHLLEQFNKMKNGGVFFNVNYPSCGLQQSRGQKYTRQSMTFFDDRYIRGGEGDAGITYTLHGLRKETEPGNDFDTRAMANGYITITPLRYDATAEDVFEAAAAVTQNR